MGSVKVGQVRTEGGGEVAETERERGSLCVDYHRACRFANENTAPPLPVVCRQIHADVGDVVERMRLARIAPSDRSTAPITPSACCWRQSLASRRPLHKLVRLLRLLRSEPSRPRTF